MKKPNYYAWLMRKFVLLGYWYTVNETEYGFEMLVGAVGMDEDTMRRCGYMLNHVDESKIYKFACECFYDVTRPYARYNKQVIGGRETYLVSY